MLVKDSFCHTYESSLSIIFFIEKVSFTCDEVKYRSVIYTFMIAFSAIATLICLFCAFIYVRILGWMLHVSLHKNILCYLVDAFFYVSPKTNYLSGVD